MPAAIRAEGVHLLNEYVDAVRQYQTAVQILMDIAATSSEQYRQSLQAVETTREKTRETRQALDAFREPKISSASHS
jgi:hypothetical protein